MTSCVSSIFAERCVLVTQNERKKEDVGSRRPFAHHRYSDETCNKLDISSLISEIYSNGPVREATWQWLRAAYSSIVALIKRKKRKKSTLCSLDSISAIENGVGRGERASSWHANSLHVTSQRGLNWDSKHDRHTSQLIVKFPVTETLHRCPNESRCPYQCTFQLNQTSIIDAHSKRASVRYKIHIKCTIPGAFRKHIDQREWTVIS